MTRASNAGNCALGCYRYWSTTSHSHQVNTVDWPMTRSIFALRKMIEVGRRNVWRCRCFRSDSFRGCNSDSYFNHVMVAPAEIADKYICFSETTGSWINTLDGSAKTAGTSGCLLTTHGSSHTVWCLCLQWNTASSEYACFYLESFYYTHSHRKYSHITVEKGLVNEAVITTPILNRIEFFATLVTMPSHRGH